MKKIIAAIILYAISFVTSAAYHFDGIIREDGILVFSIVHFLVVGFVVATVWALWWAAGVLFE